MKYKLYYWPLQGRGEQIRLLLHELEQDFEDIHIKPEGEFLTLKKQGAKTLYFKSVPMLEDGDFRLVQGPVIMNYLGRKHGLMSDDLQVAAKTEAMVLGAEDMRMAYFRAFGQLLPRAERHRPRGPAGRRCRWPGRSLRLLSGCRGSG